MSDIRFQELNSQTIAIFLHDLVLPDLSSWITFKLKLARTSQMFHTLCETFAIMPSSDKAGLVFCANLRVQ